MHHHPDIDYKDLYVSCDTHAKIVTKVLFKILRFIPFGETIYNKMYLKELTNQITSDKQTEV